jgi:hypothetical protein
MKLIFVENRYKTYFFDAIAQKLCSNGHEIHWIIQNNQFLPKGKCKIHVINYPKNNLDSCLKEQYIEDLIKSDRQQNHFNKADTSYFYYYNTEIEKILYDVKPDFVFGESTAFHELLTIANCKKQAILYLNPSTCRYPIGRFSFYEYDTLNPYGGSGELLSHSEAKGVIDQIIYRKTAPDYMKPASTSKATVIKDQIKKIYSYTKGETFNTPSPLIKFKLEKKRKKNILAWDINALKGIEGDGSFNILYPLQMQPEANIDVWGRSYRDQTNLIDQLSKSLPENVILYIKPNPKSKYELTPELIQLLESKSNVKYLHHTSKMDDILSLINLVVTVTGTIAIECVLSNKPVATLIKTINNEAKNCTFIESIERDLPNVIKSVKDGVFKTLTLEEKIDFINEINTSSYKGVISDPFSDKNCVSKENINNIKFAFEQILKQES